MQPLQFEVSTFNSSLLDMFTIVLWVDSTFCHEQMVLTLSVPTLRLTQQLSSACFWHSAPKAHRVKLLTWDPPQTANFRLSMWDSLERSFHEELQSGITIMIQISITIAVIGTEGLNIENVLFIKQIISYSFSGQNGK